MFPPLIFPSVICDEARCALTIIIYSDNYKKKKKRLIRDDR